MATVGTTNWSEIPPIPLGPENRVRFSREAYHRMFETGMLSSERRYELIDGEVVMMSPLGPPNSSIMSRIAEHFVRQLPVSLQCRVQQPVVVDDHSEPEPDLAIVRRRDDDYRYQHPSPADVMLLVEVSTSSLSIDLGKKLKLYASSGIAEYWVVDVDRQRLIVHREPGGGEYRVGQEFSSDAKITSSGVPECQLDLGWLFG